MLIIDDKIPECQPSFSSFSPEFFCFFHRFNILYDFFPEATNYLAGTYTFKIKNRVKSLRYSPFFGIINGWEFCFFSVLEDAFSPFGRRRFESLDHEKEVPA